MLFRSDALDPTRMPGLGEGGEQFDHAVIGGSEVALHQHLGHTRRAAQVSVDLEELGRVEVHQVVGGAVLEKTLHTLEGGLSVLEAGEEVDHPGLGPAHLMASRASLAAIGQSAGQGVAGGLVDHRVILVDLIGGMETEQGGDVAVAPVTKPTAELTLRAIALEVTVAPEMAST